MSQVNKDNRSTSLLRFLDSGLVNELVSMAASYAISKTPQALNRFGMNPNTEAGWNQIRDLAESRLHSLVFDDDPRNDRDPAKMERAK